MNSMFVELECNENDGYKIVYHKETKVMYAISMGLHNHGTFTVLLDVDGLPLMYKD